MRKLSMGLSAISGLIAGSSASAANGTKHRPQRLARLNLADPAVPPKSEGHGGALQIRFPET